MGRMNHQLRNTILIVSPLVAFPTVWGVIAAIAVAVTLYRMVPYLKAVDSRKHQRVSVNDLLAVLEGLTLCLSAGLSIPESMKFVSGSNDSLAHRQLSAVYQVYEFGQDLPTALMELEMADSQWLFICRILGSAHKSGAPVIEAFDSLLEYLREEAQSEISTRIRSLAVKSVLPLGICFLPAFFLLTVVPLVAQFVAGIHW